MGKKSLNNVERHVQKTMHAEFITKFQIWLKFCRLLKLNQIFQHSLIPDWLTVKLKLMSLSRFPFRLAFGQQFEARYRRSAIEKARCNHRQQR